MRNIALIIKVKTTIMLAGHYATALVAYQKYPKGTLLYFLIASQLQDLLWFAFHYLGLERTTPNDVFDTTVSNMVVNMLYSHDLVPLIAWLIIIFLIGKFLFKDNKIGLVGSALVLSHFILIAIEAVAIIGILWYFFSQEKKHGVQRSSSNKAYIIGLFVFGVVFMLSIATTSFRSLLGIPEFDLGFNTSVPTLILTYVGMIIYLNHFVPKYK